MTDGVFPFAASRPRVARADDCLLGGTGNVAAGRAAGDRMPASIPARQLGSGPSVTSWNGWPATWSARPGRSRCWIGSGLLTADNVPEIAERIEPVTRVVYPDNDPIVLAHAAALLADDKSTFAVDGDPRDLAGLLAHPDVRRYLNGSSPGSGAAARQ